MNTILFLLLCIFEVMSCFAVTYVCHKGTYLLTPISGPEVCPPCTEGVNFMSEDQHRNKECVSCTHIQDPQVEILVKECNRTHDTEILCKTGFYRRKARNSRQQDQCVRCFQCENPTQLCQGYHDTLCCGHSIFEAVLNNDHIYICQKKSVVCKQGEYFSKTTEQCLPCPPNTYMSETAHNNTECKLCQTVTSNTHRVVQACNSTHPAVFDCDQGYFRNSLQGSPLSYRDCSPCQTCQFVGRECGLDHDAVCCNSSNMVVSDTDTGPVCEMKQTVFPSADTANVTVEKACLECEYIYTDISNNSSTCRPCPQGIYSDDFYHTNPGCKDCSELDDRQQPIKAIKTSCDWSATNNILRIVSVICIVIMIVIYVIWSERDKQIILHHKQNRWLIGFFLVSVTTNLFDVYLPEQLITVIVNAIFILCIVVVFVILSIHLYVDISKNGNPNFKTNITALMQTTGIWSEPQVLLGETADILD